LPCRRNQYLTDTFQATLADTTTSGPTSKELSRSRLPWRAAVGLAILIVALLAFAWLQGGGGDGDGPLNAIAAAAEKTQEEPGGRAAMRAVVSSPERSESFAIRGRMVFDAEGRVRALLTFPRPDSDSSAKMEMVGDEPVIYMRSSIFGSLPGGREWMALDFSFLQEPDAPLPAGGDAMGELELLEAVADKVRKLGQEDVRGVPTTRYSGTVDVSDRADQLREQGAKELASQVEAAPPLKIEAWIDTDGLVRRMRYVKSEGKEGGGKSTTMDMRMDFFDFGFEPEIAVPESDEVFDATDLGKEAAGLPTEG
jgi:hypothetical protein